jgi:hypothetical protein
MKAICRQFNLINAPHGTQKEKDEKEKEGDENQKQVNFVELNKVR